MELNKIYLGDSLQLLKQLEAKSINIVYSDPPYNLGSLYYIDAKGHYRFIKGDDLGDWKVMDGLWWNEWFEEVYRVLKPGGWVVLHNIDRQSDLWTYYGRRVGLIPYQKLYWIFAGGFPRGVDVGKGIDNVLGVEREVVGERRRKSTMETTKSIYHSGHRTRWIETRDTSDLAKKYSGYQYGMITLKQTVEEILVLSKPLRPLTVPKAIVKIEKGDNKLHASIFNIPDTRLIPKSLNETRVTPQVIIERPLAPYFKSDVNKDIDVENASELFTQVDAEIDTELFDIPYKYNKKSTHEKDIDGEHNIHTTPKPIDLVKWVLTLFKPPHPIVVLDPFAGSGSIPLGCQQMNIDFLGFEINEDYYNLANKRLQKDKDNLTLF